MHVCIIKIYLDILHTSTLICRHFRDLSAIISAILDNRLKIQLAKELQN